MSERLDRAVCELVAALREELTPAAQPSPPELLDVREAARRVGISRTSLYQLLGRHEVRSIKVGRRRLVPASALLALEHEGAPSLALASPRKKKAAADVQHPAAAVEVRRGTDELPAA
jgi:excisionase family DNA binding protein